MDSAIHHSCCYRYFQDPAPPTLPRDMLGCSETPGKKYILFGLHSQIWLVGTAAGPTWTFPWRCFFGLYTRHPDQKRNTNPKGNYMRTSRYLFCCGNIWLGYPKRNWGIWAMHAHNCKLWAKYALLKQLDALTMSLKEYPVKNHPRSSGTSQTTDWTESSIQRCAMNAAGHHHLQS